MGDFCDAAVREKAKGSLFAFYFCNNDDCIFVDSVHNIKDKMPPKLRGTNWSAKYSDTICDFDWGDYGMSFCVFGD